MVETRGGTHRAQEIHRLGATGTSGLDRMRMTGCSYLGIGQEAGPPPPERAQRSMERLRQGRVKKGWD